MRRQILNLVPSLLRSQQAGLLQQSANNSSGLLQSIKRGYADDANLKKTPFYDFNVAAGGRSSPQRFLFQPTDEPSGTLN